MLGSRFIDAVCIAALACAILLTGGLYAAGVAGIITPARDDDYLDLLFQQSRVHSIDIQIDDWDAFLATATTESYSRCDVAIDGETFTGVGLRAKGNNSLGHIAERGLSRYSLKIEFDHFDAGLTYHGLDKLSLDAAFQDNSYLKTYLALDMMRFMGVPTPATSFVQVSVNGEAWGLFLAIEEPEDAFAERVWGEGHGMLYKPDYRSLDDENADVALRYVNDDPASYPGIFESARFDATAVDEKRLVDALKALATGERDEIERSVDVDEVLRYFAVQTFVANLDSYLGSTGHNYFLYEEDGRLAMLPWDYNLAFGGFQGGQDATSMVNYPIDTPVSGGTIDSRPMLAWIFESEEYTQLYHQYFEEFLSSYFDSGYFAQMMAQTKALISPYVEKDPTKFCTYEEFETGVETLEQFCLLRAESIHGQLDGTIPSTSDGQSEDSSTLVDAFAIRISDMGTMNNGMGGGMGGPMERGDGSLQVPDSGENADGQPPALPDQEIPSTQPSADSQAQASQPADSSAQNAQDTQTADGSAQESVQGEVPTQAGQNSMRPEMPGERGANQTAQSGNNTVLLAVSAVVLLAGLILVWRYRKRA